MFSDYRPPSSQPREPYQHQPNQYPFAHIHATNSATPAPNAKPLARAVPHKTRVVSAHQAPPEPVQVRQQRGPLTQQALGHGPFHSTSARPDQRRLDFSKPKYEHGRPLSVLDERARRDAEQQAELPPADTIRLFTSNQRHVQEAAMEARGFRSSAPQYVQSENNDPLSNHANLMLERLAHPADARAEPLTSASQPQISAAFIAKQTALRLASKAEQLEKYQRDVQVRLNKRVQAAKKQEQERKAQLPSTVKRLVYNMHTPQTATPQPEQQQQQQDFTSQSADATDLGLARMNIMPYHESMAPPPPAVVEAWTSEHATGGEVAPPQQEVRPFGTESMRTKTAADAGAQTAREKRIALMSKEERAAYRLLVRKQEIERERQLAQEARLNPSQLSSRGGRPRDRVAFGAALSRTPSPAEASPPRPTPRGAICSAEERDDRYRNPRSFVVRQQTAEEEAQQEEAVVHVPLAAAAARAKKSRMSAAVAGRLRKKSSTQGVVDTATTGASEKNSAYRRLLLERLHTVALTLSHPLPPLCACGFTPSDEYSLLFSYQGGSQQSAPLQPAPGQMPFNLSTLIAAQPHAASIHHHSHALAHQAAAHASVASLPAHVALDSTRHAYAHKANCVFYNNADGYIKALANLLHTFEDQQQI